MTIRLVFIITIISFLSCNKQTKVITEDSIKVVNHLNTEQASLNTIKNSYSDSLNSLTCEYKGIKFYTENKIRGDGVANLIINKIEILNLDKTIFGVIDFINESYDINLPSKIIAREIIPHIEYQVFSFDAEDTDKDYLIIYINKERKLIEKKELNYSFSRWEEYIKSAFIRLTTNIDIKNENELKYWYEVIEIKEDSMKIKSLPKEFCDYIEDYEDTSRWIKWKNNNYKLIQLNFCY